MVCSALMRVRSSGERSPASTTAGSGGGRRQRSRRLATARIVEPAACQATANYRAMARDTPAAVPGAQIVIGGASALFTTSP